MFQILYRVVLDDVPSWLAYVQAVVMIALMGLVYIQGTRRGVRFMPMFLAMAGIFMVDVFAYALWFGWLIRRGRRQTPKGGPQAGVTDDLRLDPAPAVSGPVRDNGTHRLTPDHE